MRAVLPEALRVHAALVTEGEGGWRIDAAEPELGTWGDKGELTGDSRLVQAEAGRRLLMLLPEAEVEGRRSTSVVLVAERRGGGFAEILEIPETEMDNGGDCDDEGEDDATPCWEFATSWGFVRSEGKDLWDLKTTTSGTRVKTGETKATPFSETKVYRWDGAKYAPVR